MDCGRKSRGEEMKYERDEEIGIGKEYSRVEDWNLSSPPTGHPQLSAISE